MRASDVALLKAIFLNRSHPLAVVCAERMGGSPRFRAYLERYRAKVGKKVRSLTGAGTWLDLWLELWVAARFLDDRRFEVAYETFAAQKKRGPDLTVTFRSNLICHVEIRHVRTDLSLGKWTEVLCDKLGQLPPGAINLVLVATGQSAEEASSAEAAVHEVSRWARRADDSLLRRYGIANERALSRQLARLSAVARITGWNGRDLDGYTLWRNPQARRLLPPDLARALVS
jgi:hypothetical protein